MKDIEKDDLFDITVVNLSTSTKYTVTVKAESAFEALEQAVKNGMYLKEGG